MRQNGLNTLTLRDGWDCGGRHHCGDGTGRFGQDASAGRLHGRSHGAGAFTREYADFNLVRDAGIRSGADAFKCRQLVRPKRRSTQAPQPRRDFHGRAVRRDRLDEWLRLELTYPVRFDTDDQGEASCIVLDDAAKRGDLVKPLALSRTDQLHKIIGLAVRIGMHHRACVIRLESGGKFEVAPSELDSRRGKRRNFKAGRLQALLLGVTCRHQSGAVVFGQDMSAGIPHRLEVGRLCHRDEQLLVHVILPASCL